MTSPCELIAAQMGQLFECTTMNGYTRIRTPFWYPDGDVVDLYFRASGNAWLLSDLGSTLQWLNTQTSVEKRTHRQKQLIQDVCVTYNVKFAQGALFVTMSEEHEIALAVTRLSQAAIRVADIYFTLRPRPAATIEDEVAEFLTERKVLFRRHERVRGYSNKEYSLDFYTITNRQNSYVALLSTGNTSTALELAEKTTGLWRDLDIVITPDGPPTKFVTLFDDTQDVWRPEHRRMLERDSEIANWTDPAGFLDKLAA